MEHQQKKAWTAEKTLYLVMIALLTALTLVITLFVNVPAPFLGSGGNINLGDLAVFTAGIALGPIGGLVAGSLGSALADVIGGYFTYAPFTLVIKGLEGFLAGLLYRVLLSKRAPALRRLVSIAIAACVVIVGYFFAELALQLIYGSAFTPALIASAITMPLNLVQVSVSGGIAMLVLLRTPTVFEGIDRIGKR